MGTPLLTPITKTDNQVFEQEELTKLQAKINESKAPDDIKEKARALLLRLQNLQKVGEFAKEFEPISTYINWIASIPWGNYTSDNLDINQVKTKMDEHHYGLEETKMRILEYLAVVKLQREKAEAENKDLSAQMSTLKGSSSNAPILCFVGIQGVGKTSLAKSIANALGRKFYRIALGGMTSVTALRGISRGLEEPEPGQIIKGIIRTGVMNPLILLDEVDKVSSQSGVRADVMAALLEILDPEQNATFTDHYLDFPIDLSKTMFITTANNLGGISAALLDRLEIIRFSSYTDDDKIQIARNYMLPKVLKATGILPEQLKIHDDVWPLIVRPLGFDAGIRELERTITRLSRKVAMMIVKGEAKGIEITAQNFRQYIPEDFGILS